ncbi:MAG: BMP family ABC transporter substrate-binding protein [Actinomycetota bacterium]
MTRARPRGRMAALATAATLMLAACTRGSAPEPATSAPPGDSTAAPGTLTVALVLAAGGTDPGSVNASAIEGLDRAVDAGAVARSDTEMFEPNVRGTDRRAVLARAADSGARLVVAIGPAYSRAVDRVRRDHRRQLFAVVQGDAVPAPNVANLGFAVNEAGFLAGAAAAMKSKTGTVGFLGGQSGTGLVERAQSGFEAGAREVDPDVGILVSYLGTDPEAFADPDAGRAVAASMYANGADVIAHYAGASGMGLFAAATELQRLAIGSDVDETALVPEDEQEAILTSAVDRVDVAVEDVVRAAASDTFVGGFHAFGLAEGGVDYAVNEVNATPRLLSDAMRLRLDELAARVAAGEIVVPLEPDVEPEVPGAVDPTTGPIPSDAPVATPS